jgi:hypothetical protein
MTLVQVLYLHWANAPHSTNYFTYWLSFGMIPNGVQRNYIVHISHFARHPLYVNIALNAYEQCLYNLSMIETSRPVRWMVNRSPISDVCPSTFLHCDYSLFTIFLSKYMVEFTIVFPMVFTTSILNLESCFCRATRDQEGLLYWDIYKSKSQH